MLSRVVSLKWCQVGLLCLAIPCAFAVPNSSVCTIGSTLMSYTANCTPYPANLSNNNGATANVVCPGFSAAGAIDIASVSLTLAESWSGGDGTSPTSATITATAPSLAGVTWSFLAIASTGNGTSFGNGLSAATTTNGPFPTGGVFGSVFFVGLQSTYRGFLSNNAGNVTVTYTYDIGTTYTSGTVNPA